MFRHELNGNNIARAESNGGKIYGEFKVPPVNPDGKSEKEGELAHYPEKFVTVVPTQAIDSAELEKTLLEKLGENYGAAEPRDNTGYMLAVYVLVTLLLFAGVWLMFRRTRDQVLGGGLLAGFAKSPAKRYQTGDKPITFEDVAGLEGVKGELEEIVEFLKNPENSSAWAAALPKGVLLMGPPGTGKTLLAGPWPVRRAFPSFRSAARNSSRCSWAWAPAACATCSPPPRTTAPSILFIDEIDAVGRHRGAGLGGGHDEREQTLNQILSEMDGFTQTESVIVMAATNRPDVLDPALLRPGRFDRHITVDRPNYKGRLAIFKVHMPQRDPRPTTSTWSAWPRARWG